MRRKLLYCVPLLLLSGVPLFGQASASLNGRVTDPQGAPLVGAAVSVSNAGSGISRETNTNGEGLYSVPSLVPGNYDIKVTAQGFSVAERSRVELLTGSNLSVDIQMALGTVQQTVSVESQAQLVESSQATQGSSIRPTEVAELPILNRNMASMMTLIPGAREIPGAVSAHGFSSNYVSIGGGGGTNYDTLVDGIEDKEDQCGGTIISYNLDSILEFKTLTNGANAEYGRGTGQVLIATKSGTNDLHGSAFGYFRNQDLVRTDYFSDPAHGGLGKPPFLRNQFGGSVGGPVIRNKLFYFGSLEYIKQNFSIPRPASIIGLLNTLAAAEPSLGVVVNGSVAEPSVDYLYMGKVNWQPNAAHSLFARWSGEYGQIKNDFSNSTAINFAWEKGFQDLNKQYLMNGAAGDTWVINATTVNQFVAQWISFKHDNQYPVCPFNDPSLGPDSCLGYSLATASGSLTTGVSNAYPDWFTRERKWQWADNLSVQLGRHSFKTGVDYMYMPTYGGFFAGSSPGTLTFFDDPNVIAGNLNGKYPLGFNTPGIIRSLTETSYASSAQNIGTYYSKDNWTAGAYIQDDFKVTPTVTLNLGLRWDAFSLFNSYQARSNNAYYLILKAIGSPFGANPGNNLPAMHDIQPRVGLAWDVGGKGTNVFRISYGIFYNDQIKNTTFQQDYASPPQTALYYTQTIIDPSVGSGQLGSFVYGVSPLPAIPPTTKTPLPGLNTAGYWYDPGHSKDGETVQYHVGYSHTFAGNSVLALDHTDIFGYNQWRRIDVNPLINGTRILAPALQAAFGSATLLGPVYLSAALDHSVYDETVVHYEKRFRKGDSVQVNYILGWANGMAGNADGALRSVSASLYPQTPSATGGDIFAPWEWGPTSFDERHRVTATGVINVPFKIEVAPTMTFASGRPYTLFSAANPSGDGLLQLRNSAGVFQGIGTQRGEALFILNARVSRMFPFGKEGRYRLAAFAEIYNITDRANFGVAYGGNAFAPATYLKPTGYIGGVGAVSTLPNSFQVQFGGRFTF